MAENTEIEVINIAAEGGAATALPSQAAEIHLDVLPDGKHQGTPAAEAPEETVSPYDEQIRTLGAWISAEVLEPTSFKDMRALANSAKAGELLPLRRDGKMIWDGVADLEDKPYSHYDIVLGPSG